MNCFYSHCSNNITNNSNKYSVIRCNFCKNLYYCSENYKKNNKIEIQKELELSEHSSKKIDTPKTLESYSPTQLETPKKINSVENKLQLQSNSSKNDNSFNNSLQKKEIYSSQRLETEDSEASNIKRDILDDFEFVEENNKKELGRGAYGLVKLVREKKTGKLYAIKIMSKNMLMKYSTVENVKQEIRIQKKISHFHITKLYKYFENKENVYLILEYAENGSLFQYFKKKTILQEHEAFVYFFQTCLGLDYLHKKNIIHRDLKPENLLLDKQGNIKLCDFGWSAQISLKHKRQTFCGTIEYMAPEMILNESYDYKLDIWCLGVLLYELLHGKCPFSGKSEKQKLDNILKISKEMEQIDLDAIENFDNIKEIQFSKNVSFDAKKLILQILQYNPEKRLTMKEIFNHPWLRRFESHYKINIENFVYSGIDQFLANKNTPCKSPEKNNFSINLKNEKYYNDISINDNNLTSTKESEKINLLFEKKKKFEKCNSESKKKKFRITGKTIANVLEKDEKTSDTKIEQPNFVEKLLITFGCINRGNNNNKKKNTKE